MTTPLDVVAAKVYAAIDACDALDQQHVAERKAVVVAIVEPLRAEVERLFTALSRHEEQRWLPIETAPRDGTTIAVTDGHYIRTAFWARLRGVWSIDAVPPIKEPTHWCQIPALDRR